MRSNTICGKITIAVYLMLAAWQSDALAADASTPVSDNFNRCTLNKELWTVVDPLGDSIVSVTGVQTSDAHLVISIPAGQSHDMGSIESTEVRVMQPVSNTDFVIRVKLESQFDTEYQMNGLLVMDGMSIALRYVLAHSSSFDFLNSGTLGGGWFTDRSQQTVPTALPCWLGMKREGDQWTLSYSLDGSTWIEHASYSFAMNVTQVGLCAGNFSLTTAPAFTARFDYFLNTAKPFTTEDGPLAGAAITANANGNGVINADPYQSVYFCDETVALTAVPQPGWAFTGWSGDVTGSSNPIQVIMSNNRSVTATFVELIPRGSLQVTIEPAEAIAAGARWRVDSGTWQVNGAVVDKLIAADDHVVSFRDVAGWNKPADLAVKIVANQKHQSNGAYAVQRPAKGSLQVIITPDDANIAGAQWNLDGGAWQNSSVVLNDLWIGNHVVSFKNVSGWNKPDDQGVNVSANQVTTINPAYVLIPPQTGSLRVTIAPHDAAISGGQWSVDGGDWINSGAISSGLTIGNHVVSFKNVTGWIRPVDQALNITANQVIAATGNYDELPPAPRPSEPTVPPNQQQGTDLPSDTDTPSITDTSSGIASPPAPMCGFGVAESLACSMLCMLRALCASVVKKPG